MHSHSTPELEAAKEALLAIHSGKNSYEINNLMLQGIYDLISIDKDPKRFVNELCTFMQENCISSVFLSYLFEANDSDAKLAKLLDARRKDGHLQNYSLNDFKLSVKKAFKAEEDDKKWREAYRKMTSFSPPSAANDPSNFDELTVGKLTVFIPKKR